nr:carboxylesterase family protein [Cryobacterium sinapicolor]
MTVTLPEVVPTSPRSRLDVRVTGGIVRGVDAEGILAWRGIPYAAPPVGDLRFRAPQPVVPWEGVREPPGSAGWPRSPTKASSRVPGRACRPVRTA